MPYTDDDEPYADGSSTSQEAAESMAEHATDMGKAILEAITTTGATGMTCDQTEALLGYRHQSASARINKLEKEGLVVRTCKFRETRSGRRAQVYVASSLLCPTDFYVLTGRLKEADR